MTKASIGLGTSIWANKSHYASAPFYDYRARSVPPPTTPTTTTPAPAPVHTAQAPVHNPPSATPTRGSRLSPAQAFHRFEQACQRLRWKFLDLQTSYQRAMAPEEAGFTPLDAERNFKIDFHEFYSWIEQAIVLLLHIFGIVVSRGDGGGGAYAHAYHHNVLRALEDEACPVYEVLGRDDVNQALWKAKELRNRWKDAAEGKETPPLKMYDLTWIVGQVLGGLEMGYGIAAAVVEREVMGEVELGDARGEDEWEWMVEAMDWEA